MIDLSKAFDKINNQVLIRTLRKTTLPDKIVNILDFIFNNSYAQTIFNGALTEPWKVGNGVRQGGILSPILFSFYINEVISDISDMTAGCSLWGNQN